MPKQSAIVRDRYFIMVLLLPLFCGTVMHLLTSYTNSGTFTTLYFQALLKNISWFAIGLTLLIKPEILIRAISTQFLARGVDRAKLGWALRFLGVVLVMVTSFSSQFLIREILRNAQ